MPTYAEDAESLRTYVKVRYVAFIAVVVSLFLTHLGGVPYLDVPRAIAWGVCAYTAYQETQICKRIGRSPDMAYLRILVFLGAAALNLFL